jgi:hypothetical protein
MCMPELRYQFTGLAHAWRERFLQCADRSCTNTWRALHRITGGAGSIHLDGARYCFPESFERQLRQRLTEIRALSVPRPRPPHRVPIGLMMLSRGELNNAQLRHALEAQQQSGEGKIGEWIRRLGYAGELQVTGALALQCSCPVLKTLSRQVSSCGVPLALLREFRMVPVQFITARRIFHLAFGGSIAYRALLALAEMIDCKTEACLATASEVDFALEPIEQRGTPDEIVINGRCSPDEVTRIVAGYAAKLPADEVRISPCIHYLWVRIRRKDDSLICCSRQLRQRHSQNWRIRRTENLTQ